MKLSQTTFALCLYSLMAFYLSSCSSSSLGDDQLTSLISVNLNPSESTFENLFVEVQDVQLRIKTDASSDNAWVSLNTIAHGTFDLCDIDGQFNLPLVQNHNFGSTYIYEIKLLFAPNSFINNGGVVIHLDTENLGNPIASNSLSTDLIPNRVYDITINFDVANSIQYSEEANAMVFNPKIYTEIRHTLY